MKGAAPVMFGATSFVGVISRDPISLLGESDNELSVAGWQLLQRGGFAVHGVATHRILSPFCAS